MVAAGMRDTRGRIALALLCALFLVACGDERQDADAPSGRFDLDVVDASFPAKQKIAETSTLKLEIENTGDRAVPNLAVTVETEPGQEGQAPVAFGQSTDDPTLAASARPVWVLDDGPVGGESAYTNTWAVGPLGEGQSRTVEWRLTAARAGRYTVAWRLAPSLEGDVSLGDGRTEGSFDVTIADEPVPARVNGDGEVVRGEEAGR
jgi:hypothetical protein